MDKKETKIYLSAIIG